MVLSFSLPPSVSRCFRACVYDNGPYVSTDVWFHDCFVAVTQDLQDQEEAGEEDEAEQAYPSLDPYENW